MYPDQSQHRLSKFKTGDESKVKRGQNFKVFEFLRGRCLPVLLNGSLYPVGLEVWSKLAQRARIKRIASKFARDFDCDWQRVSAFSHSVTLTRILLSQIISHSDTKGSVLVVMECKRACKCDLCIGVFTSYFKVNRV